MTAAQGGILHRKTLIAYALPGFVLAIPTIPVYIFLPALYGDTFGLGLALTGAILLIARLFDVITDPIIGRLSDRLQWSAGRRKPMIVVGAMLAGLGLVQIVSPPDNVGWAYLLSWSALLYFGWTLVAIPYAAWGAELSQDYSQRVRITSAREAAALFGILSASAFPTILLSLGYDQATALSMLAWITVVAGVPVIGFLIKAVPEVDRPARDRGATVSIRTYLSNLQANRPFLRLIAAWAINGFANGLPAALFILYLQYGLEADETAQPRFILVYFLAAIVAIPFWQKMSRRFGKHRTWCLSMSVAVIAFASVPLIPAGAFTAFFIICLATGASLGADLALPPAMQADVVDYDEWKNGEARAGFLFALWSMATKFAQAIAVGIGLPLVTFFGFDPAEVTESGQRALAVIYAWLPIVFKLFAVALVWNFALTARRLDIVQKRLAGRQRLAAAKVRK